MKLSFSRKQLLIAAITALAFLAVIAVQIAAAARVERHLQRIEARYVPMLELAPKLEADLERLKTNFRDAVGAQDRDDLESTETRERELLAVIDSAAELITPAEHAAVKRAIDDYYRIAFQVSARLIQGETGEAILGAMAEMQHADALATLELRRATSFDRTQLEEAFESLRVATRAADWGRIGIAVVALTFVLALSSWISRGVTRSVGELSRGFGRFAEGRLDQPMEILSADELGEAARTANRMAESLRSRQEELRRANEELREQTAELDSFSYSVSHDLRAPLRAIDGFTRILLEDHAASLDDEGRRIAGVIRSNTQKMGRLIDDLLAFSRLGRQPIVRRAVDMAAAARSAFEEAARLEPSRTIRFELTALPPAQGDLALLQQVWSNLLGNAVKYTRPRPEPTIEVSGVVEADELVYAIKDNGVGFDMQYADKLFGVFQRLHRAAEFEGTGVGLALVARIVKRHGGRVWAESAPGAGATFRFTLPKEGA